MMIVDGYGDNDSDGYSDGDDDSDGYGDADSDGDSEGDGETFFSALWLRYSVLMKS